MVPSLRWRIEQFGQWILREWKYCVPSRAISSRPSRRRIGSRPPCARRSSTRPWNSPSNVRRRHAVEQLPDVVVAGDAGQAEQGVRVGAPALFGQRALVRQEGRGLHEEHRQRRHADVPHGVLPVATPARVRQAGRRHARSRSRWRPRCFTPSASTAMTAASTARRSAAGIAR